MLSAMGHKQSRRPAPKYVSSKKLQPLILIVVLLFKSSHAQHVNFLLCEEAPVAAAEILLSQTSKEHTVELDNSVSEAFEDTADNTVLAAVYLDATWLLSVALAYSMASACTSPSSRVMPVAICCMS